MVVHLISLKYKVIIQKYTKFIVIHLKDIVLKS